MKLYRKIDERFRWLDDNPQEADWSDLFGKVLALCRKLADALDVVYHALGCVNVGGLIARLEACGETGL